MIKNFDEFINESIEDAYEKWFTPEEQAEIDKYNQRREEARRKIQTIDTYHYHIFYMVKYTVNGVEYWSYNMSNTFLYNLYISPELGYKSEDDFKKFIYSCFTKEKPNILKYYEERYGGTAEVIASPKWILKPLQSDAFNDWNNMKQWMKNAYNDKFANKKIDNRYPEEIDGGYKKYHENFFKLDRQFREDFEKISNEYSTNPLLKKYNGYILNIDTVKGLRQRASRRRY